MFFVVICYYHLESGEIGIYTNFEMARKEAETLWSTKGPDNIMICEVFMDQSAKNLIPIWSISRCLSGNCDKRPHSKEPDKNCPDCKGKGFTIEKVT